MTLKTTCLILLLTPVSPAPPETEAPENNEIGNLFMYFNPVVNVKVGASFTSATRPLTTRALVENAVGSPFEVVLP